MTKLSALALALTITACAPGGATPKTVDAYAVLPDGRLKNDYIRYYLLITITNETDLPFTTSHDFALPAPHLVWAGVYVRTPSVWTASRAGMHVVKRKEDFPEVFHGGCDVVNIVADAHSGQTLGSWCNVDDGAGENGMPRPAPQYIPAHSPLR